MGNHEHDHPGIGKLFNQLADTHHRIIIQAAGGLIEVDCGAALYDCHSDGDPLFLTA